ncbi:mechanosensitive ion channel family protein [Croceiramulus getboli]|nr:mechanosensitive ion channel [Flavobacteriaceae bacterium YJPT1-3]
MRETLLELAVFFRELFIDQGMEPFYAKLINAVLVFVVVLVALLILDRILRFIIVESFRAFTVKTKTTLDDYLLETKFPRYIAHIFPIILFRQLMPIALIDFPESMSVVLKLLGVYIVYLILRILRSLLRATKMYLKTKEEFADKPLDSYMQVLMLFFWGFGLMLIISIISGQNKWQFAAQVGAASAVLLLIFKDTILGFVASIQVSVNDIVRIGDWITFSKYGADGYVTEINLATVRVQNFDNTFTTIPTYSLISDSFQNWRGMQESEGRRIKRSILIKQNSVRFVSPADLERFKKISLIAPYIDHRELEVSRYNKKNQVNKELLINGRNQTNLGIFRKYADAFLHENPAINKNLFLMVRHLAPTPQGIPVEIFCFSRDKQWENYEHIQADIFDHLLSAVPYFDLEIFEAPTGQDIAKLQPN